MWLSRLLNVFGEQEARILVLGLDNAGKTTILCEQPGRRQGPARKAAGLQDALAAAVVGGGGGGGGGAACVLAGPCARWQSSQG